MNNLPGKLYVVATPIGNLSDLSPRAAETLSSVDFIAAEDTRVTAKILNHIGVKKSLVSCQKYNERERSEQIVSRILAGENAAFCSDAGTPVISDPGGTLVAKALDVSRPTLYSKLKKYGIQDLFVFCVKSVRPY